MKYIFYFFIFLSFSLSQSTEKYYHKSPLNMNSNQDAILEVSFFNDFNIQDGILFFRKKNDLSYQETSMYFSSGSWIGTIPKNQLNHDEIEYLIVFNQLDGGKISVPERDSPYNDPLTFKVIMRQPSYDTSTLNVVDNIKSDILILSPEPNSVNRPDDLLIAVSLFNAENIDTLNFKLLLDGEQQSNNIKLSDGILTFLPVTMSLGKHEIKLLFNTTFGLAVEPISWNFRVQKGVKNISSSFKYNGNFESESSLSEASNIKINEQQSYGKINTEINWAKVKYSFRNSSRESAFLQPLDRQKLSIQITDYLTLEYGDIFPSISPYVLNGKRVRGNSINIDLPYLNFQSVSGELIRGVDYKKKIDQGYFFLKDDTQIDSSDGSRIFNFSRNGYTFPRSIYAMKLSFDVFKVFSAGIHFSKTIDKYESVSRLIDADQSFAFSSIDTTRDSIYIYNDKIGSDNSYTFNTFNQLAFANGDSLFLPEKNWSGIKPKENLVAGFDFETALDNRNVLVQFSWNFSLTNNNIWDGALTLAELDTTLDSLADNQVLDIPLDGVPDPDAYKNIFTINQYMVPFAIVDPITLESNPLRAIINMPSSAFHFRIKGSYSFNNLLIEYKQVGPEFYSFGNPYMTNNIREFIIKDRVTMLGNRLMFVVGYNSKDNNLSETVLNPLKTKTISLSTTLVPGAGAPSLILNLQSIGKTNGVDSVEVDSSGLFIKDNREDSKAINTLLSLNIPAIILGSQSIFSLNLNLIKYTDMVETDKKYENFRRRPDYFFQKADSRNFSFNMSSRFKSSFKTSFSINKTELFMPLLDINSKVYLKTLSWTSINNSSSYYFNQFKINVNGGFDYMSNGSGDNSIQLMGIKLGGDYKIIKDLIFKFKYNIRFSHSKANKTDNIDNDKDGKIDNGSENWIKNNSGLVFSLGYRF